MTTASAARKQLRAHALKQPAARADEPWPGEHVVKVGKKIFVFLGNGPEVSLGVKLPRSLLFARAQKFVQKMGYGMDKSGWVAVRFSRDDEIPLELLRSWIDESYETVAATALPKRKPAAAPKRKAAARGH
jgi:predicted DNA-binding protein (MmcQ/YjbR family)